MKLLLVLFFIVSCSQDSFEEREETVGSSKRIENSYTAKEMTLSCELGCVFHYDIYRSANQLVKNAVSLTKVQLDGIQYECKKYCKNLVFNKITQIQNLEDIKNIKEVIEVKKETEEELDVVEKKVEVKKKVEKDDELRPFEDL